MSPTPAQQARAAAIAAEITARLTGTAFALPGTLADRMTRCGYPGCRCHADPRSGTAPTTSGPAKRRQDRHPDLDRRLARRLRPLVRRPPPPARPHHRTRGTQPRHRRSRPPLEPLASPRNRNNPFQLAWQRPTPSAGTASLPGP
ncbi:MAG: DUF6788 family protein [Streptosporangiaceae bacterium]